MAVTTRPADPATIRNLRKALLLLGDCDEFEAVRTLGDIPETELDSAVELLADLTERVRRFRSARDARVEATHAPSPE